MYQNLHEFATLAEIYFYKFEKKYRKKQNFKLIHEKTNMKINIFAFYISLRYRNNAMQMLE